MINQDQITQINNILGDRINNEQLTEIEGNSEFCRLEFYIMPKNLFYTIRIDLFGEIIYDGLICLKL